MDTKPLGVVLWPAMWAVLNSNNSDFNTCRRAYWPKECHLLEDRFYEYLNKEPTFIDIINRGRRSYTSGLFD